MMRMMVRARREIHVSWTIQMRHIDGGSLMVIARSTSSRKSSSHGRSCVRIMVTRYQTINHCSVRMIKSTTMVMSSCRGRKHSGWIVCRVSRVWRPHYTGTVRKLDRGKRLGPLVGRKELGKCVKMMR